MTGLPLGLYNSFQETILGERPGQVVLAAEKGAYTMCNLSNLSHLAAAGPAIVAEELRKSYGKTQALAGVDLQVEEGSVLGVLGPNGAGKTTLLRILTTLMRPDGGRARVAGHDVTREAAAVRARIGLTGQYAAIDEQLTGTENLVMFAQLYHVTAGAARRRAGELLEQFDLGSAASRLVKTYSGGMRRRLDLAASLIMSPPILFLDEPTTGLDPRGRLEMWSVVSRLAAAGKTVFLTTQYLEEADQLATHIAVLDQGKVIATGTPTELKARIGGERLVLTLAEGSDLQVAQQALLRYCTGETQEMQIDPLQRRLLLPVTRGAEQLATVIRDLDDIGISIVDLALRRPTLDDVFLALTGRGTATPALAAKQGVSNA